LAIALLAPYSLVVLAAHVCLAIQLDIVKQKNAALKDISGKLRWRKSKKKIDWFFKRQPSEQTFFDSLWSNMQF